MIWRAGRQISQKEYCLYSKLFQLDSYFRPAGVDVRDRTFNFPDKLQSANCTVADQPDSHVSPGNQHCLDQIFMGS